MYFESIRPWVHEVPLIVEKPLPVSDYSNTLWTRKRTLFNLKSDCECVRDTIQQFYEQWLKKRDFIDGTYKNIIDLYYGERTETDLFTSRLIKSILRTIFVIQKPPVDVLISEYGFILEEATVILAYLDRTELTCHHHNILSDSYVTGLGFFYYGQN